MATQNYFRIAEEEVLEVLGTSREGLSGREASRRLNTYGKNELQTRIRMPLWLLFLLQFKELLVIILVIGGLISILIGDYRGSTIIFIIVLVNALIGFIQEYRAGKIVDAMKVLLRSPARVKRDGELVEMDASGLVPGDIVVVEEGDNLPADIRLLTIASFMTNDFALTGESMPQEKTTEPLQDDPGLADRTNMAYAGTTVASGNAIGVVVATGMASETGKIAGLTEKTEVTETPLQQEMRDLARKLTVFVIIIGAGLFAVGLMQDFSITISLVYALGVAMAVVPQALPAQVTVALTTCSSRLAKRNAIIKNLPSVETLGSTTVICTDKTGTLTRNEMTVRSIWFDDSDFEITGTGYEPRGDILDRDGEALSREDTSELEIFIHTATMASNAEIHEPDEGHPDWYPVGDPTEAAIVSMAAKLGFPSSTENRGNPKIQEFSFDSRRKRMSSIHRCGDNVCLAVKGSMEGILSISGYIYRNGKAEAISEEDRKRIQAADDRYSAKGLRVLAIARKELEPRTGEYEIEEMERDVTFLGLVAMIDPPKEGVREAVSMAHRAGIRIFVLTGDYPVTAEAIAREIGIAEDGTTPAITGQDIRDMSDADLKTLLAESPSIIFSRVDPEDKLNIVSLLVEQGEIVAVTGDGVNDAPALRKAHIGVAMGKRGTDVAKEAAKLVLLDDSFPTLVHAIREGRTIYDNLRKTVFCTLTTNSGELTLVLLGLMAVAIWDFPIPILAVQILAIDLLGQIMPLTFLTFDPPSKGQMMRPPRNPKKRMLELGSGMEVVVLGILIGGLAFVNFLFFMHREGIHLTVDGSGADYIRVTTLTYATIVFCQYVNTLERRYGLESLFNRNLFTNKILLYSIGGSIGLVMLAVYAPFVSDFLRFGGFRFIDWLFVGLASSVFLCFWEILKFTKRRLA